MNKYELAVVVSAKLEDEAYEIQKMTEGFYYFVHFEAESTVPGEVEQRIRIMDNVLRYLCVKQEA